MSRGAFTLPKVGAPTHSAVTSRGLPRGCRSEGLPWRRSPPERARRQVLLADPSAWLQFSPDKLHLLLKTKK